MSGIVCAIRGGPASQPTIELAIQTALEYDLPIYFLYIVDLDFLAFTNSGAHLQTVSEEMNEMGEFILLVTQTKAEKRGVTAHGIVRHGEVSDEIIALSHEVKANFVILGQPKKEKKNVFTEDLMSAFASRIATQTDA